MPTAVPSCVSVAPVGHRGRGRDGLGDAEVRDHRGVPGEQHVVRLDVAVHDAVLVRVRERARDVAQDAHRLGDRQRPAAQPRAQALALDERHRVVGQPVEVAGREHRDDVRLLERRGDADLALEPRRGHRRGELGREHLHDDLAAEAVLVGDEHARHAAAAELALERIAPGERLLKFSIGGRQSHGSLGSGSRANVRRGKANSHRRLASTNVSSVAIEMAVPTPPRPTATTWRPLRRGRSRRGCRDAGSSAPRRAGAAQREN